MSDQMDSVVADLAAHLAWPVDSARVDQSVVRDLNERGTGPSKTGPSTRRRKLAYALAAVAIMSIVVYSVPPARQAVANLFGAAGIHITFGDPALDRAVGGLGLGTEVGVDLIDDVAGFDVVAPGEQGPGIPDKVFVGENGEVNMVWAGTPELPAAGDTGIGLLFTQRSERSEPYTGVKTVAPDTDVEAVLVGGAQGFWIEGAPHSLVIIDETGLESEESRRLAANVLLWAKDGISFRLETRGDLASALAIAESLAPLSD